MGFQLIPDVTNCRFNIIISADRRELLNICLPKRPYQMDATYMHRLPAVQVMRVVQLIAFRFVTSTRESFCLIGRQFYELCPLPYATSTG